MRNKPRYVIGIDPGGTATGFAIWDRLEKVLDLRQFNSHCEAILFVHNLVGMFPEVYFLVIEDARLVTKLGRKIPRHKLSPEMLAKSEATKQGAGAVKALSKDWEKLAKLLGVKYEMRPPMNTKTSPEEFYKITKIKTLKTHSHKRDAGMMVYKS